MNPNLLSTFLGEWRSSLQAIRQRHDTDQRAIAQGLHRLERDDQARYESLAEQQQEDVLKLQAAAEQAWLQEEERNQARLELLRRIGDSRRRAIAQQRDNVMRRLRDHAPQSDDDSVAALTVRRIAFEQGVNELKDQLSAQQTQLKALQGRLAVADQEQAPARMPEGAAAEAQLTGLQHYLESLPEDIAQLRVSLRRYWLLPWQNILVYLLIVLGHAGLATWLLIASDWRPPLPLLLGLAVTFLVACGIRLESQLRRQRQCRERLAELLHRHALAESSLPALLKLGQQQLDVRKCMADQAHLLIEREQQHEQTKEKALIQARRGLERLERRCQQLEARQLIRFQEARQHWEERCRHDNQALQQQHEQERCGLDEQLQAERHDCKTQLEQQASTSHQELEACRDAGLRKLQLLADRCAPPPYLDSVLGELHSSLHRCCEACSSVLPETELTVPLQIDLPLKGQLWLRSDSREGREQSLTFLRAAALQLLRCLPPGQLRLSIFDPVGLGQGFAPFLPLIEHDERLLGPKIWTQSQELERRLKELVDHSELVIQKHLQQKHPDVAHYNAGAGELAAPYHLIILLDAPEGVRELARERLRSLLTSGPRCGVLLWMHQHQGELLPREAIDGWALHEVDGALQLADPTLADWQLRQTYIDPAVLAETIDNIGRAARETSRVAIRFEAGMPAPEEIWTADSAAGLRLPIGRCGAEKLQYFELGQGMAQHVLLGGRTGSGKSTLLHVLISNACLWYGPDQLQLSLIDFKKGVEFRAYAREQLPQARVVAIESDREFALSVLEDIDQELDRRGRIFRERGVQNLQQYRTLVGETMPRHLLVIDEFHEFFADDDGIARSAALFLDRLVRQGRAFGIHAVLGSQSLAGCYALGKSTLGQIAVRIALQCNEADSYLLLSEDNPAARYLDRPGEGIYNDHSGLPEGNAPFQTFWLDDDERSALLADLRRRAGADAPAPFVFEGNAPAQLIANRPLRQQQEDHGWRCWLGEPNALSGPAAIDLHQGTSPHLLVVGQHREAACGIACASILAALRQHGDKLRIDLIDASGDHRFDEVVTALNRRMPGLIRKIEAGKLPSWSDEFSQDQGPRLVVILGLDNLPLLAESEEDPFGLNEPDPMHRAGTALAECLRATQGGNCHVLLWCAAVSGLQRSLQRKTRQALSRRVLFQMSPADSNEIIDDGSASRLGLYHALLAEADSGRRMKFRPYLLPSVEELLALLPEAYRDSA